mgnify:CR=1 FL=1
MLNRRLLRSKVVQALYAIIIAEESNRQLAYDEIAEAYKPDLNSMEPQNLPQLERYRQLATKLFDELVEKGEFTLTDEIPHSVEITAKKAFAAYRNANKRDRQNSVKRVLAETENIYTNVIYSLRFLTDLAHSARLERNRTHHNVDDPIPLRSGLDSNIIIKALENDKKLADEAVRRAVSWADDIDIVQRTYREVLRKDSAYRAYCEKVEHTLEEDQELIQNIFRTMVFKSQLFIDFMEARDLYWEDHKDLVRSLCIKTLKSATAEGQITLAELTDDWEDDKYFVEELVAKTLAEEERFEGYLKEILQNWDNERLAKVDMLIIKAALAEMMYFPGIPVKVTINEFIETAKRYSTLQSGKFVNGLLDTLSERMMKEKLIRKSGKGLIDNQ